MIFLNNVVNDDFDQPWWHQIQEGDPHGEQKGEKRQSFIGLNVLGHAKKRFQRLVLDTFCCRV